MILKLNYFSLTVKIEKLSWFDKGTIEICTIVRWWNTYQQHKFDSNEIIINTLFDILFPSLFLLVAETCICFCHHYHHRSQHSINHLLCHLRRCHHCLRLRLCSFSFWFRNWTSLDLLAATVIFVHIHNLTLTFKFLYSTVSPPHLLQNIIIELTNKSLGFNSNT